MIPRLIFVNPRRVFNLIATNHSYYRRFCSADWKARGARNLVMYLGNVITTAFDDRCKRKLEKAVSSAARELTSIQTDWFDGGKCSKIPFRIGAFVGESYENGLPHTIDNVILLEIGMVRDMSHAELVRLLKHEQVHIFQRLYPNYVRKYLIGHSFSRVKTHTRHDGIRANPDTDGAIYQRFGEIYAFKWKAEKNVRSLNSYVSQRVHPRYEHPFEEMAYKIEKMNHK